MGGGIGEGIPSPRCPVSQVNKSSNFSLGNHFMVRGIQVTLPPHVVPGMIHGIRPGQTENQESTRSYPRILTAMAGEEQLFPLQLPREARLLTWSSQAPSCHHPPSISTTLPSLVTSPLQILAGHMADHAEPAFPSMHSTSYGHVSMFRPMGHSGVTCYTSGLCP